jgi:FMN phosphatase YigB (HAD superfamily)
MSTSDYAYRKPDARILLTACKKIGYHPSDVWYVGNSIPHDIVAARAAGMPAIWYNASEQQPEEPTPDTEIKSWSQLHQMIDSPLIDSSDSESAN